MLIISFDKYLGVPTMYEALREQWGCIMNVLVILAAIKTYTGWMV